MNDYYNYHNELINKFTAEKDQSEAKTNWSWTDLMKPFVQTTSDRKMIDKWKQGENW